MKIDRRTFLTASVGAGVACGSAATIGISNLRELPGLGRTSSAVDSKSNTNQANASQLIHSEFTRPPAFGIIPVVSDGKWIWKDPPKEKGYLEPRDYEVSVGMTFRGQGNGGGLSASTVAPVSFPEQEIQDFWIESENCRAWVAPINAEAAQLFLASDMLAAGQTAWAVAHYRMRLRKSYMGFEKEQFPSEQTRIADVPGKYLKNSPGIKAQSKIVKDVVRQTVTDSMHPWDKAYKFYQWVWENIQGVPGRYTSVEKAIKNKKGDCEERACTFIALCRAAGIPARQVWVPSHVWAEIALHNEDGTWSWIPIHTAAYPWFGWTGAHEVVLQKGDHIRIAHRRKTLRLIDDWYRIRGPKPAMQFTTSIKPIAPAGQDPGPGGRQKNPDGKWVLTGDHPANKYMRDQ